jgi:sugar lactone lactonase YvrE
VFVFAQYGGKEKAVKQEMGKVELIVDMGDLCGESPIWEPDLSQLYWTDIVGRNFQRYSPDLNRYELLHHGLEINGFALKEGGGFVITNSHGVWRWDGVNEPTSVLAEIEGHRCRLNDCIADPVGRLLTGSWHYDPNANYELGKLISIDVDGRSSILDEGIHGSNGLAFSADQRTLYFADSVLRTIYAYDYDLERGTVANRRVLVKLAPEEGLPDGLTVDSEGFVWSAQWYGGCVIRYDPDGHVERRIALPAKQIASLTFGGLDLSDIYITTARSDGPSPLRPHNYDPTTGTIGGALYRVSTNIRGVHEFRCLV